jgi:hypothetical protein
MLCAPCSPLAGEPARSGLHSNAAPDGPGAHRCQTKDLALGSATDDVRTFRCGAPTIRGLIEPGVIAMPVADPARSEALGPHACRSRASLVRSAVSASQHLYRRPCSPLHSPAIRESTRKTLRDRRRVLPASGVKICSAERASCGKRGDALAAAGAEPRMRRARSPAIGVARGLIFHFRPAHGGSLLA